MKIQFLDGTALAHLRKVLTCVSNKHDKKHQREVCSLFTKDTNADLLAYLKDVGIEEPLRDSRFDCTAICLDPNTVGLAEVGNIKSVRDALANISPAIASNEKFWAGLCIGSAWNYVRDRWHLKTDHEGADVLSHYMFGFGARRSLTRNALSRLWWIGQLTINPDCPEDPYKVTKFVLEDTDYVVALLERNTSDNPHIVYEIIDGVLAARSEGYHVERRAIRELAKYVNIVGGVDILDLMPEGAIRDKVLGRARKICKKK